MAVKHNMYIWGGNGVEGSRKDTWQYNKQTNTWRQLADLPSSRYSMSGHVYNDRWLISFGGCPISTSGQQLLVMDLERELPKWVPVKVISVGSPGARCRHASELLPVRDCLAEPYVVAGFGSQAGPRKGGKLLEKKLKDVWHGTIDFSSHCVTVR